MGYFFNPCAQSVTRQFSVHGMRHFRPFQSTRPAWGVVRFVKQIEHVPYVSIHAPAWGATFQQFAATSGIGVSIHAFEREQGHHRRRDRTEVLRFNPRCIRRNHSFPECSAPSLLVHASRAGRDDWLQCPGPGCTFQPACLARGVSKGAAHWVCNWLFQSTRPARGTTMSASALTAGCQFHVLLIATRSTPRRAE